jgi:proteic killer suppression protein
LAAEVDAGVGRLPFAWYRRSEKQFPPNWYCRQRGRAFHYDLRNASRSVILSSVIVSYRDKRTRDFVAGRRVKAFAAIERSAQLKLDRLDAATSLRDLAALPGNRFEALAGDRKGQFGIRINDR